MYPTSYPENLGSNLSCWYWMGHMIFIISFKVLGWNQIGQGAYFICTSNQTANFMICNLWILYSIIKWTTKQTKIYECE